MHASNVVASMTTLGRIRMRSMWALALIVAAAAIAGCASMRERKVRDVEDMLAASGFVMRPADTADKAANLQSLPPHKLVMQRRDGQPYYVYADPAVCKCVWVGDQKAYAQFQQLRIKKQIADEQLAAAEAYSDAALNWGVWGPWPWGP
jgi:hypothetical protein